MSHSMCEGMGAMWAGNQKVKYVVQNVGWGRWVLWVKKKKKMSKVFQIQGTENRCVWFSGKDLILNVFFVLSS